MRGAAGTERRPWVLFAEPLDEAGPAVRLLDEGLGPAGLVALGDGLQQRIVRTAADSSAGARKHSAVRLLVKIRSSRKREATVHRCSMKPTRSATL